MTKKSRPNGSKIEHYFNGKIFINYGALDLKKTIDFYQNALKFEPSDFSKTGPDPQEIGLFEFQLPSKGAILTIFKTSTDKFTVSDNLVIMVENITSLREVLTKKQISATEIKDVPNLLSFFTIKDPDGNTIMFMSEPRTK